MFKIETAKLVGVNTEARKQKFVAAVALAESIINGSEIEVWFGTQKFTQLDLSSPPRDKLTNTDLLLLLRREAKFNYYVQGRPWYKRFSSVMGWEDDSGVYTYGDTFDGLSISGLAGHLVHEATHQLGFSHAFNWSVTRDSSFPYKIGNYVESVGSIMRSKV